LKQCRNGFYVFDYNQKTITEIKSEKSFYQKSAYDYNLRRSKDKQMFGYESLEEGKEFCFEIEFDEGISEDIISDVCTELTKTSKNIGRSRTAQYGLVKITDISNEKETKNVQLANFDGKESIVYADGRLIFFDKNGNFTFQPTAQDLGFGDGAEIDWNKSQVRTFSYSPWNHKRKTYDSVREGIEKGSVFVVKTSTSPSGSSYKGLFNNEGFGKIIYNPDLFETDSKGKSVWTKPQNDETPQISKSVEPKQLTTPLLKFLYSKKQDSDNQSEAYDAVEVFIDKYKYLFSGDKFASQWGSIRCLAMLYNGEELIKMVDGFLDHGVAKDKWEDRGRKIKLDEFMEANKNNNLSEKIINLSSEMAKICRTTKTIKK